MFGAPPPIRSAGDLAYATDGFVSCGGGVCQYAVTEGRLARYVYALCPHLPTEIMKCQQRGSALRDLVVAAVTNTESDWSAGC
jgi:hypothetical protein